MKISAYQVPDVILTAPRRVFVGLPADFSVAVTLDGVEVPEDQFVVQWSETREDGSWVAGTATKTIVRQTEDYVSMFARVRLVSAPDVEGAWEDARTRTTIVAEKAPRVHISGDKRAEFGKNYTFTASVREPYSGMDIDVLGYWLLPDSSEVEGASLEWSPSEADLEAGSATLTYVAWIDGVDGTEIRESLVVSIWDYVWPDFRVIAYGDGDYSPADIQLRLEPLGLAKLSDLGDVTISWEYPLDAFTLDRNNGDRLYLRNIKPGDHLIKALVSNPAREISTTVEATVETLSPPDWTGTIDVYGDNAYMREPLEVRVRANPEGGHPKDRVETWTWRIAGTEQTVDSSYIRTTLNAGTYPIEAIGKTSYGNTFSVFGSVTVNENKRPSCTVTASDRGYYWSFSANCEDQDGSILSHRWTVNGREMSSTASRMSLTKSEVTPEVSIVGTDDSGADSPVSTWNGEAS